MDSGEVERIPALGKHLLSWREGNASNQNKGEKRDCSGAHRGAQRARLYKRAESGGLLAKLLCGGKMLLGVHRCLLNILNDGYRMVVIFDSEKDQLEILVKAEAQVLEVQTYLSVWTLTIMPVTSGVSVL